MAARIALAVLCLSVALGTGSCPPKGAVVQFNTSIPGFVEPHTPGAPGVVASSKLQDLLGPAPDLNRVSYVRTWKGLPKVPVTTVVIFIPGFLGGATTFDPLARDLVRAGQGKIEVWAVDRRPNQLEDQLGGVYAREGTQAGDPSAIFTGAQFYFSDLNQDPPGDFPGPGDLDLNLNGSFDPQTPLTDAFGVTRLPILFAQDDLRFTAHWGVDTYMRDWRLLVQEARKLVGPLGHVVLGGHSMGTGWAARFAAYDFDPGPGVEAGYSLIDGLILLEGGGMGPPSGTPPTLSEYQNTVTALETPGGPEVVLENLVLGGTPVLKLTDLGTVGQVAALAAFYQPDEPSLIQRTPIFGSSLLGLLLSAPATNEAIAGMFLDDDFSANPAFRATMGFVDETGPNFFSAALGSVYVANAHADGSLRTWKTIDETLPTCPPHTRTDGVGCAINTDPAQGGKAGDREVSLLDTFLRTQFETNNGFEWYFVSGRVNLDFSYGNDSSSLGDESLLAVTQTGNIDIPVLAIGGSNGLTPTTAAYATFFNSIATPAGDKKAFILDGYAHVDPLTARTNEALPLILDFLDQVKSGASPVFP